MDHQDFKVVVLRKNSPPKIGHSNHSNQSPNSNKKKEEENNIVKPKTFTIEFGKKLASHRVQKNMSRKDLALKLNVKESVIADVENGKQLYDGNIVHKLKRIFPSL
jgi:ribosome-binding protein aMBF1 (putative translation factor)